RPIAAISGLLHALVQVLYSTPGVISERRNGALRRPGWLSPKPSRRFTRSRLLRTSVPAGARSPTSADGRCSNRRPTAERRTCPRSASGHGKLQISPKELLHGSQTPTTTPRRPLAASGRRKQGL